MWEKARSGAVVAVLCAVVLAACGSSSSSSSSNGVASKSPQEILSATSKAASTLSSVHIVGTSLATAQPLGMNLTLSNNGSEGTITESGETLDIRSVGSSLYVKAGAGFWKRFANAAVASLLTDKWLKAPRTGQFSQLATLTDKQALLTSILANHPNLKKGSETTVNGRPVVGVVDATSGGTLYVATTGQPYPIEITGGGSSAGRLVFNRFNESVTVSAPPGAVDLTSLTG